MKFIDRILGKPAAKENITLFQRLEGEIAGSTSSKFSKDIFTNKFRTIHEEFRESKKAYLYDSLIFASAKTMVDLIKGDGYEIETNNEILRKFIEDYVERTGLVQAYEAALEDYVSVGNGYIEIVRDSEGNVIKYLAFTNGEDIYIDYDYRRNQVRRYIQRVLTGQQTQIKSAKNYVLNTPQGPIQVYGVEIPKENLLHFKNGNNVFGAYGKSPVSSILNDLEILRTIERSIAVISKYKAIPKKILTKKIDAANGERPMAQQELQALAKEMSAAADYDNLIMNGDWQTVDLSDGGKDINMEGYIEYLKRKVTIPLAPEFLIHSQDVNRATSKEAKQTYFLRIQTARADPEMKLTALLKSVLLKFMRENPQLTGTFEFKFGTYDIILPEEKEVAIQSRWNNGIITLNEARQELGLPEIEGTEVFNWEVAQQQSAGPSFEKLKDEKKSN